MANMPTWEEFIIPTLKAMSDGVTRTRREIHPAVASAAGLTEEQRAMQVASGQLLYANRIGWGLSLLTKVGALARPIRGSYVITEAGRQILADFPNGVSEKEIKALGEDPNSPLVPYVASVPSKADRLSPPDNVSSLTPTELIQAGIERINEEVSSELLSRLMEKEPAFFEQAVVDLLLKMGYGGQNGRGSVTNLVNDGGIDGVIDQDVLGLNKVYIQAKRYGAQNSVGRPDIQAFVGALSGKADAGVFITTSRFSDGAEDYARSIPTRVILVDGEKLASLMIQHGVGVQTTETFSVVEIDEDFFA